MNKKRSVSHSVDIPHSKTSSIVIPGNEEKNDVIGDSIDYIKLSKDCLDNIGELAVHSPAAFRVLLFFIKYMNTDNNLSVSYITLQELLGYNEKTIKKAVKHLEANGWIIVWKEKGASNAYTVNKKIAAK